MENKIEHQTKNLGTLWKASEVKSLGAALAFAYKMQNTYKEPLDLKDRVAGWRFVLEDDYSVAQVLHGLKEYLKTKKTMPVPSDIRQILNPEPPKVTQTQYLQACKAIEASGFYNKYGENEAIKNAYEEQNSEDFEHHHINQQRVAELGSGKEIFQLAYGERNE